LDLIEKSVKIDNRLFERRLEKHNFAQLHVADKQPVRFQPRLDHRKPTPPRQAGYYGPQPMDLDAIQVMPTGSRPSGKLSPAERSYRQQHNLCLYCGKPGHKVANCFAAGNKPKSNVSTISTAIGKPLVPHNNSQGTTSLVTFASPMTKNHQPQS
jgi:hypothetical protein